MTTKILRFERFVLAIVIALVGGHMAHAQRGSMQIKRRPPVRRPPPARFESPMSNDFDGADVDTVDYESRPGAAISDTYEGEVDYNSGYHDAGEISCTDGSCGGSWFNFCNGGPGVITTGVEFTFLHPSFESNVAAMQLESDGATQETFTDLEFAFDTKLAPRVWVDYTLGDAGVRGVWWEFNHGSDAFSVSPPDNGFGRITPPFFGEVDLSTTVPGSVYSATSQLFASSVDLEGTRCFDSGCWKWVGAAGIRYAQMEQTYLGSLTNAAGNQQGTIDYRHDIEGVGPTLYLRAQRPLGYGMALFGSARGALLFGQSTSELNSVEDLDLDDQLTTQRRTGRDDVLPIAEMQVGVQLLPPSGTVWHPYFHVALESQYWGGVGNASSEDGSMGFFGGNVAIGVCW